MTLKLTKVLLVSFGFLNLGHGQLKLILPLTKSGVFDTFLSLDGQLSWWQAPLCCTSTCFSPLDDSVNNSIALSGTSTTK